MPLVTVRRYTACSRRMSLTLPGLGTLLQSTFYWLSLLGQGHSLPLSLPFSSLRLKGSLPLLLDVGHLTQLGSLGSVLSSHGGVRRGAPAENEFLCIFML